ncbi:MAG: tetratricopeptide repeat protein [Alphaproteobacteria bacterium]
MRLPALFVLAFFAATAAQAATQSADTLLAALAKAKSADQARAIEKQLEGLWSHSGSPSADLLLKRGRDALEASDLEAASAVLKALTRVAPAFAEGWHMRAVAALEIENYEDAIVSLRRTLQLEPRNYNALLQLGGVLEEFDDKPRALAAYRRALAVNPYAEGAEERIRALEREVEGQRI